MRWTRNHYDKAELAASLARDGKLTKDLHDLMLHLNDVRKDISYGEPGSDLLDEDPDHATDSGGLRTAASR